MKNLNKAVYGAVMLAVSGASFAWDARTEAADHVVYWGGATASTLSAMELTVDRVCVSDPALPDDTNLFYVKSTTNDGPGNDWAVACRGLAGQKTGLAGKILVIKRDRGGSGVGVGPVQSGTPITFLTVNNTNCSIAVTPGVNSAPQIPAPEGGSVAIAGCNATGVYTTSALTEIGTSDIEPDKFGFELNIPMVDHDDNSGTPDVPFPFLNGVAFGDQDATGALVFNTPVTLALRNKLQEAQFPVSSVCNPAHANYLATSTNPADVVPGRVTPTNAESVTCMPSLSRHEINSLLTNRITNWNQLLRADGTAVPGLSGVAQICRRVPGSGTQATINALLSSYPCDANRADNSTDIMAPRAHNGTTVLAGSGSSNVDSCLHTFNGSANPYAIGVLSVEGRNSELSASKNWRFIKVDGYAPTLENVHNGAYWLWAQQSIQRRAGISAEKTAIYDALAAGLNDNVTLAKLNQITNAANCSTLGTNCGSTYSFGVSGWLATAGNSQLFDNVLNPARPVNSLTREVTAGKVNICQTPVKQGGANLTRGLIIEK